jgi:hypothetical protein
VVALCLAGEGDDGDLAGRLLLVVREGREDRRVLRVEAVALFAGDFFGDDVELIGADFDGGVGVGLEVQVPVRV